MAQGSHVPKFGNWDGDNVPYTAYFEKARRGKGGKIINPNDPEENPEVFAYGGYEDASINVSPANTHLIETPHRYNYGHCRNLSAVEDKSISGYSINETTVRRRTSDAKKNKNDRSNIFVPPSPNRLINSRNPSDDLSYYSSASVPKFGAWDEKDPKSGEGFTVIFNKVKEEKQIAAAKFPIVQPQPNMPSSHKRNAKSKVASKFVGCYYTRVHVRFGARWAQVSFECVTDEFATDDAQQLLVSSCRSRICNHRITFVIKGLGWVSFKLRKQMFCCLF